MGEDQSGRSNFIQNMENHVRRTELFFRGVGIVTGMSKNGKAEFRCFVNDPHVMDIIKVKSLVIGMKLDTPETFVFDLLKLVFIVLRQGMEACQGN